MKVSGKKHNSHVKGSKYDLPGKRSGDNRSTDGKSKGEGILTRDGTMDRLSKNLITKDGRFSSKGIRNTTNSVMASGLATKENLVRKAYHLYTEDYMRNYKTRDVPHPVNIEQLKSKIKPYVNAAAEKLPPEIYDVVPSLTELSKGNYAEAGYELLPVAAGLGGSLLGPEGKVIGEIGGRILSDFLRWGIEQDGFKKLVDFVSDALSEIGSFVDDVISEGESIFSDVGSALGWW